MADASADPLVRQARDAAARAASFSNVAVGNEHAMNRLRDVAALLTSVWGSSPDGAPLPPDVLRAISHAGCNVTVAHDDDGRLLGTAVAIVSPDGVGAYSLIAAVAPDVSDRGIGFALKLHQRAWALERGFTTLNWTFDPLVSRNARFNLTKLGAHCDEYLPDFYGPMADAINTGPSDRLAAVWPLTDQRSVACSEGQPPPVDLPDFTADDVSATGPDGQPFVVDVAGARWCRVPADVVVLRRRNPDEASQWRTRVGEVFVEAFGSGYRATGVTRTGWYRLTNDAGDAGNAGDAAGTGRTERGAS
ncbi:GNAT family N-acetyltransferase [Humibacillus sp. DSM 29435]|uniref:GNAT family N-acetyltransferase n=1 Tax=Humibacillus sp. DSM 29435 TaxID=1869167 RepID=UPI000A3FF854|nr:GNAT family N-acetyltransferase [Humibacillus sp. DSM 29435]